MAQKPSRNAGTPEKPDKPSANVTLPPIDAEPEEIARALFQRPPLKRPDPKETEHD